jgi:hypothetical protein
MDLLDEATRARKADPKPRILTVAQLEPNLFGVLDVTVQTISPVKTFQRKTGGEGQLRRVTLGDQTGEVDLVLWGSDVGLVTTEFSQGRRIRMRGPTVKAGWQGGIELAWDGCIIEDAAQAPETKTIRGTLVKLGPTKVVGSPPQVRFQAEVTIESDGTPLQMTLWDDAVKQLRQVLPGAPIVIIGLTAHPSLENWYLGDTAHLG